MTTSSDVKFILNIQGGSRPAMEKKEREKKKKPDGMNRELFNLIGGTTTQAPSNPTDTLLKEVRPGVHQGTKWVLAPFTNPARTDSLALYHWQKETEADQPYPYAKLNKKVEIIKYTPEEYQTVVKGLDPNWTKEETDFLWDLCERFDLRFVVITDRFNMEQKVKRTVEEIKDRYFSVAKKVLEHRGDLNHPIVKKSYNMEYEVRRKNNLEKLYSRTQEHQTIEKQLLDTLKMLEQRIKKEEKEIRSLKKQVKKEEVSKVVEAPEKEEDKNIEKEEPARSGLILTPVEPVKEEAKEPENKVEEAEKRQRGGRRDRGSGVYLRSELLKAPLPIPDKEKKKLHQIMKELEIPEKLMPTADVIKSYDILIKEILELLSLEKILKKKERERKSLEGKIEELENKHKQPTQKEADPMEVGEQQQEEENKKKTELPMKDPKTIAGNLRRERKLIIPNLGKKIKKHKQKSKKEAKKQGEIQTSLDQYSKPEATPVVQTQEPVAVIPEEKKSEPQEILLVEVEQDEQKKEVTIFIEKVNAEELPMPTNEKEAAEGETMEKKRGRPKKKRPNKSTEAQEPLKPTKEEGAAEGEKNEKKRGRPKKKRPCQNTKTHENKKKKVE